MPEYSSHHLHCHHPLWMKTTTVIVVLLPLLLLLEQLGRVESLKYPQVSRGVQLSTTNVFVQQHRYEEDSAIKKRVKREEVVPDQPFLEVDGKKLTPSSSPSSVSPSSSPPLSSFSSSSPSTLFIVAREKNAVNLRCVVSAASPPVKTINFFIGDQNVTHLSQFLMEYLPSKDKYTSQSSLTLNITKDFHGKTLTCSCAHLAWKSKFAEVSAIFDVQYEPLFSISREPGFGFPITEGMTVMLRCEIESNPWSRPSWIKDTSNSNISIADMESPPLRTDEEGSFTIISAKASDSGWYRCVTDNPVFGHVASFGYYLNVRFELPSTLEQVGEKLPLSPLSSEANSISLGQNGEIPSHPQLVSSSGSSTGDREDRIPPLGPADSSNSFDTSYTSMRYGILQKFYDEKQRTYCGDKHGLPLIVSINRTVNAIVGRPISLTAEFCCHPSPRKVFWIHRHLALAPGRIIGPYVTKSIQGNSRNCYTSTFDIDVIKPEDAGVISFIVSNSNGLDDVELTLNVTRVEFSVSGGTPSHIPPRSSAHLLLLLLLFVIKAMT